MEWFKVNGSTRLSNVFSFLLYIVSTKKKIFSRCSPRHCSNKKKRRKQSFSQKRKILSARYRIVVYMAKSFFTLDVWMEIRFVRYDTYIYMKWERVFKNGISRVAYRFESVRRRIHEMGETGWRDFSKESGRERKVYPFRCREWMLGRSCYTFIVRGDVRGGGCRSMTTRGCWTHVTSGHIHRYEIEVRQA